MILTDVYGWMESSDRVRDLQEILEIEADGVYGMETRSAHAEQNYLRELTLDALPKPPTQVSPVGSDFLVPGVDYAIRGSGFAPESTVEVWLYSEPTKLGQAAASGQGTVEITVVIPVDTVLGNHQLELAGSNLAGEESVAVIPVVIGLDSSPPWVSSVSLSAESVDVTYGDATITATVVAGDDGAGIVAGGGIVLGLLGDWDCPGADAQTLTNPYQIYIGFAPGDANRFELVSGDTYNGIWEATVTIPAGLGECLLQVGNLTVCDELSHCLEVRGWVMAPADPTNGHFATDSEIMDQLGFTFPTLNITRTD